MTLLARAMEALRGALYYVGKHGTAAEFDQWAAILAEYDRAQGDDPYKEAIDCLRAVADERCGGHWQWADAIIKALDTTQGDAT